MVLDTKTQTLFIFGGQRDGHYLSDMYAYHIPTNTVTELFANFTVAGGPDAFFTQRAVIDKDLREIYVFCGLTHQRAGPHTILESESPYWIYRYERPERPGKWAKILPLDPKMEAATSSPLSTTSTSELSHPVPRYAHQVVYDPSTKSVYMHGGNASLDGEVLMDTRDADGVAHERDSDRHDEPADVPVSVARSEDSRGEGDSSAELTTTHLADFWKMQLVRPAPDEIVRRCRYLIRQQKCVVRAAARVR